MIVLNFPPDFQQHREWVARILLKDFLGIDYRVAYPDTRQVTLAADGKVLTLPDTFFSVARSAWMQRDSLPDLPLARWDTTRLAQEINLVDPLVPVVYGSGDFESSPRQVILPIDILGSAFVLLSRYEETVCPDRDRHGRFPCDASLACRDGFIGRPLIDEYVEVLWVAMKRLWPGLHRRHHAYRCVVTCDVDHPFDPTFRSPLALPMRVAADLFKRRSLRMAADTLGYGVKVLGKGVVADRMWTFDWMMSACERHDLACAFYFIVGNHHPLDGHPYWGDRRIDGLLREIHDRGHEIGLHASYQSLLEPGLVVEEADQLRLKCADLGIEQQVWGGRQHYLRWLVDGSWRSWSDAGLDYDSTLTYAEQPGFRCGTCRPYTVFDLNEGRPLSLVERPLVLMEGSVLSPSYKGVDHASAWDMMSGLQDTVRQFRGEFVLLWHNSHFQTAADRELYTGLLAACR